MSFRCGIIKCFAKWVHLESATLSGTFLICFAPAYCFGPDAESCCEEKTSELSIPCWDQGEIPPSQAKNGKVGSAETKALVWAASQNANLLCAFARIRADFLRYACNTMILQNACLYAYTLWGTFQSAHMWKCLMVSLELSTIINVVLCPILAVLSWGVESESWL